MRKLGFVMLLGLGITACGDMDKGFIARIPDQCIRARLFQECLKALPAGPVTTRYNDWDEVVDSCSQAAYYQSIRDRGQVKPECGG